LEHLEMLDDSFFVKPTLKSRLYQQDQIWSMPSHSGFVHPKTKCGVLKLDSSLHDTDPYGSSRFK
jgi:hypothetical protein